MSFIDLPYTHIYPSPIRFLNSREEFTTANNIQNNQYFGSYTPYPLEKGRIHRYPIANYGDFNFSQNLKLFIITENGAIELYSYIKNDAHNIFHVTFICYEELIGYLEIRDGNTTVKFSECVSFINSDFEVNGVTRKYIYVATKHHYNRHKFLYQNDNTWFVTNIPAYCLGMQDVDVDAENARIGGNSSQKIKEAFTDFSAKYEVITYGDSNVLNFIKSVMNTNNELFIDGTKRTSKDKVESGEFLEKGTLNYYFVTDDNGDNIIADYNGIFSDLKANVIELTPADNSTIFYDNNFKISILFDKDVKISGNPTKKLELYQFGGSSGTVLLKTFTFSDFSVSENEIILNNIPELSNEYQYHIEFDDGLFLEQKFDFPVKGINNNTDWNFFIKLHAEIDSLDCVNTRISDSVLGNPIAKINQGQETTGLYLFSGYTGGNAGIIENGSQDFIYNGITFTCDNTSINQGNGTVVWSLSGTPTSAGIMNIPVIFLGETCNLGVNVTNQQIILNSVTYLGNNTVQYNFAPNVGTLTVSYSIDGGTTWVNSTGGGTSPINKVIEGVAKGTLIKYRVTALSPNLGNSNIIDAIWNGAPGYLYGNPINIVDASGVDPTNVNNNRTGSGLCNTGTGYTYNLRIDTPTLVLGVTKLLTENGLSPAIPANLASISGTLKGNRYSTYGIGYIRFVGSSNKNIYTVNPTTGLIISDSGLSCGS